MSHTVSTYYEYPVFAAGMENLNFYANFLKRKKKKENQKSSPGRVSLVRTYSKKKGNPLFFFARLRRSCTRTTLGCILLSSLLGIIISFLCSRVKFFLKITFFRRRLKHNNTVYCGKYFPRISFYGS